MNSKNTGNTLYYGNSGYAYNIYFDGIGEWTLQDSVFSARVELYKGTLNLNNQSVKTNLEFQMRGSDSKTLNMGNSHIYIKTWNIDDIGSLTLDYGTSTIELLGADIGIFDGENQTYNNVIINGEADITGANTFTNLVVNPGSELTLPAGLTQTISGDLLMVGENISPITINSSSAGVQATFSKATGTVNALFVDIKGNYRNKIKNLTYWSL